MDEKIIIPHIHSPSVAVLSKANPNNEKKKRSKMATKQKKKRKEAPFTKKGDPSKNLKSKDSVPLKNNTREHIDIKV